VEAKSEFEQLREPFWFSQPGVIRRTFYCVFEGGGAKGIAYIGALQAMQTKQCWFRAVAGASAGAITAMLVASGLSPSEIHQATNEALALLHTGIVRGLRRLRRQSGYFPSDPLHECLERILRKQVAPVVEPLPDKSITFRQLFQATGIELNVAAADLSLRRPFVFSPHETPNCSVADAVVASSAIPFAFRSSLLKVPDNADETTWHHHTIVDGGVWSNFPLFIFEDAAFRKKASIFL